MIKRISRVAPLQFGVVSATLYALLSLIFVPFFLIFALLGAHANQTAGQPMPGMVGGSVLVMAIVLPIMYAVLGFIFGVIGACIYNLVAGWTGGFEITLSDAPTAVSVQTMSPPPLS